MEFNPDKYTKTCWTVSIAYLECDNFNPRLIIRVATGRKYWPIFSGVIDIGLGKNDTALSLIEASLYAYTFPMIDRFMNELEIMLTDIYQIEIKLKKPHNHDNQTIKSTKLREG